MRKHNLSKSLSLSTQTVRSLVGADLTPVVGGYGPSFTCAVNCQTKQANAVCDTKQ
jgi:hypothetical protein